jgi:hypothetical protein
MCFDGVCLVLDLLSQIVLGIVIYYTIKKLGFSSRIARWAFLVPVVYVIDLILAVMEMDRGGWFGGPESLGLPFEIFSLIAPFTAPVILMIFLIQEPMSETRKSNKDVLSSNLITKDDTEKKRSPIPTVRPLEPRPRGCWNVVKGVLLVTFWTIVITLILVSAFYDPE